MCLYYRDVYRYIYIYYIFLCIIIYVYSLITYYCVFLSWLKFDGTSQPRHAASKPTPTLLKHLQGLQWSHPWRNFHDWKDFGFAGKAT